MPYPIEKRQGLLEPMLSAWRAKKAISLIPSDLRREHILDLGSWSSDLLRLASFREKVGLDVELPLLDLAEAKALKGVTIVQHDLNSVAPLPFEDQRFDVITMLAVIEHIDNDRVVPLLSDARRILRSPAALILTTPARWTPLLLRAMAWFGLVSADLLDQHQNAFSAETITSRLREAGWRRDEIEVGYFEGFANMWVRARK